VAAPSEKDHYQTGKEITKADDLVSLVVTRKPSSRAHLARPTS